MIDARNENKTPTSDEVEQIPQRPLASAAAVRDFFEIKEKLSHYAFPLRTDTQNIPFDTQVILLGKGSELLAIGIRLSSHRPDYICAYGIYTPIADILAWYPTQRNQETSVTPVPENVRETRYELAASAYETFEFADGLTVKDHSGWEDDGANEFTRTIYLEPSDPEEDNDDDGASISATFVVRFAPNTAEVAGVYAYDQSGNDLGRYHTTRNISA